jgi:hypothetical protein
MAELSLPERMYPKARGWHAFPLTAADSGIDGIAEWKMLAERVAEAKRGDFSTIPGVLDVYDHDADWVRRGAYVELMGDAGPDALLERIHGEISPPDVPVDYVYDFAETLFYWGRLDAIPTLVEIYRENHPYQDAHYIPPRLSLLLEEERGPLGRFNIKPSAEDAAATCALALERHAELREQLGERAFVFRGRLLDPRYIAERTLQDLAEGKLDPEMRRKLEAMTGVDCSSFYADQVLQPLAAAVVLEDFLAGPLPARFTPGRRYFFGHPVPASTVADDPLAPPG